MSDRKRAIETLKQLRLDYEEFYEEHNNEVTQAYDMAISSLETDEAYQLEYESTSKNDLGVDWESYKDVDGNSLDDLILEVLQNNFDCGNTYGYKVADEIIGLLPSATPQEPTKNDLGVDCVVRQDVERYIEGFINEYTPKEELEFINLELDGLKHIPTVTPQEPILDKITKIIEPLRHVPIGEMSDIEWDILRVIDKYKAEVRDNNG